MFVFLCVLFKKYSTLTNELPGLITVGHKWLLLRFMDGWYYHWNDTRSRTGRDCRVKYKNLPWNFQNHLLQRVRHYAEEEILPWLERSL